MTKIRPLYLLYVALHITLFLLFVIISPILSLTLSKETLAVTEACVMSGSQWGLEGMNYIEQHMFGHVVIGLH